MNVMQLLEQKVRSSYIGSYEYSSIQLTYQV